MSKELKQDKYEGLGNGPWIKGYFPTAKQECIWNIPEEKRYFHCKFCTANCVNAHAVSTPTELEQAAEEFAEHYADEREYEYPVEETDVAAGFKAGAEWQKKQMCKDCPNRGNERNYIKGFNAAVERIEVELLQMKKKYKEEDL